MVERRRKNRSKSLDVCPAKFSWLLCSGLQKTWCMLMLVAWGLMWRYDGQRFVMGMMFSALLILIALLDCRYLLIYDRLVAMLLTLGVVSMIWGDMALTDSLAGSVVGGGSLGLLHYLSHGGMGWGDVKLAAVLGWWLGTGGVFICLYIAFMLGGLYGLGLLVCRRFQKDMVVPFGPFLAVGGILALVLADHGEALLEAWLWME